MARLPRLSVGGMAHLVLLRGHNGESVFRDDDDRRAFLAALGTALKGDKVALHGYALQEDRVWLLCTPRDAGLLGQAMQSLGRRFASAFNRRHDRSGSVWDGRYRSTLVEQGTMVLRALVFVDQLQGDGTLQAWSDGTTARWSSASHHLGLEAPLPLSDTVEYWSLGNTPFDRASAYRALLSEPPAADLRAQMEVSVLRSWPLGSTEFIERLRTLTARPIEQRLRGRPRKPSPRTV